MRTRIDYSETTDLKVTNILTAAFALMDSNDDGTVDENEYAAFQVGLESQPHTGETARPKAGRGRSRQSSTTRMWTCRRGGLIWCSSSTALTVMAGSPAAEEQALADFEAMYGAAMEAAVQAMMADAVLTDQMSRLANNKPTAYEDQLRSPARRHTTDN